METGTSTLYVQFFSSPQSETAAMKRIWLIGRTLHQNKLKFYQASPYSSPDSWGQRNVLYHSVFVLNKEEGEGREFCSEIEEDADGGGRAAQPSGSRFYPILPTNQREVQHVLDWGR